MTTASQAKPKPKKSGVKLKKAASSLPKGTNHFFQTPTRPTTAALPVAGGDADEALTTRGAAGAFERAARFCDLYDALAFDPDYDTLPLEVFEPMVRRVLSGTPWTKARPETSH